MNCDICDKAVEAGQPRFGAPGTGGKDGPRLGSTRHYSCHTERYGRPDSRPMSQLFAELREAATGMAESVGEPRRPVKKSLANPKGPYNRSPNAAREFRTFGVRHEMGRKRVEVECPFCFARFWAYVWSLFGGGKRCTNCGAMHASHGSAYPVEGNEEL